MKDDKPLQRDVLDKLDWEPSIIDAAEIGVTVRDGIVTLTGHVSSYTEKVTAERVAKPVHGVKAVANDLEVRLDGDGRRTDTDIARAAIDALKGRTMVPDDAGCATRSPSRRGRRRPTSRSGSRPPSGTAPSWTRRRSGSRRTMAR